MIADLKNPQIFDTACPSVSNVIELRILICPITVAVGFSLPFTRNINDNGNRAIL